MIRILGNEYHLETAHTAYRFRILPGGLLEHISYGPRKNEEKMPAEEAAYRVPAGNTIAYSQSYPEQMPEMLSLEVSSRGKGDLREPFVEVVYPDGSRTCSFLFEEAQILPQKAAYETLPGSYGLPGDGHLCVRLREEGSALLLELHYYVYEVQDVICRSARLVNEGDVPVRIGRLMSQMLDLPGKDYEVTTFTGAWAREMEKTVTRVHAGTYAVSSVCGFSSNRANPFFMVSRPGTTEEAGECFGFHLIYSGNHYEAVQVGAFGNTRVISGICPEGFLWLLGPGEVFEAPEAILSYSAAGFSRLSLQMQRFIRDHIVRGPWKERPRPVLLNSWEAFYYDYDEEKLLDLARAGRDVGIELFVLDDGWFGKREDDTSSLGDWTVNRKKLPDGLDGFSRKIRRMGLSFGIWVEPEMVNVDSDLYRAHPDWVMQIPGHAHAEGRNQRVLDLANPAVVSYLTDVMTELFSSAEITYVKWDVNRFFSDVYSPYLDADRQGETAHRYILGLYRLLDTLTRRFPEILFEGCAAGGGRFDPGMLCYFPQIWASDNTDPVCRAAIQTGYSYGYPMSCLGAHVSASPNHQTGRSSPLSARFHTALFGVLGYELDLLTLGEEERAQIRAQIAFYRTWRHALQGGDFFRPKSDADLTWLIRPRDGARPLGVKLYLPADGEEGEMKTELFAGACPKK